MKKFWIVIRAPKSDDDVVVSKSPGTIYQSKEAACERAKQVAVDGACMMLVLEVVDGFMPCKPPVEQVEITE